MQKTSFQANSVLYSAPAAPQRLPPGGPLCEVFVRERLRLRKSLSLVGVQQMKELDEDVKLAPPQKHHRPPKVAMEFVSSIDNHAYICWATKCDHHSHVPDDIIVRKRCVSHKMRFLLFLVEPAHWANAARRPELY